MKISKKILCAALAVTLASGAGACGGGGGERAPQQTSAETTASATTTLINELDEEVDYADMAEIEGIDQKNEEGTGPLYVPGQKAGLVKGLCYYDFNTETPELSEMLADRFGGYIETSMTSSGTAYFEKLNMLIAAGDSPDLVRYDWDAYPWGVSKKMYTALDEWLDMDSPLWADEKDVIEQFSFLGKHYYFPQDIMPNYALVYNRLLLEDAGLSDPMDLYEAGEWDWNAFEEMMTSWIAQGEEYIGLTGNKWAALMFIHTTGTKVMDLTGNEVINNMKDANVQRTMDWILDMRKQGLIGDGWISPGEAFIDGKLLFLAMGWEWAYTSAQEGMFRNSLDYDMAFVPYPKDPQADKYYLSSDTVGYMVPAGAKNVQGAVDYILCSRIYATDPEIIAADRAEKMDPGPVFFPKCPKCKYNFTENNQDDLTICPECGAARKQKFKEYYSERQLNVLDDMYDTEKFEMVYDASFGMGDDFNKIFVSSADPTQSLFDGPIYHGTSYTQLRDTYFNVIESYLEPYRNALSAE